MEEPSLHSSRRALAGGLAAALLVGGAGFFLGRGTTEPPPPVSTLPAPAPTPVPEPAPEPAPAVLGRAELTALAATAADNAASGRGTASALREVDGRRFELRLPFGCAGPAAENSSATMRWRYDAEAEALRINVAPQLWPAEGWWASAAPPAVAAVRGFWIARPWSSSEACPAERDSPGAIGIEPITLPGQTLAIGQILSAEEAPGEAGERASFAAVVRVPEAELDLAQGLRLRITGRIARIANAGPVQCQQPAGPEQRPICLIGVVMDEVAIENPATGATLATWDVSSRQSPSGPTPPN